MSHTDYTACPRCRVRVIWPGAADATALPALNWGPDPAGTVAVQPPAGAWLARLLAAGEKPAGAEQTFRLHECRAAL